MKGDEQISKKNFIKYDNPDDLDGTIQQKAMGDPETLVETDSPDDVETNVVNNKQI